MLTIDELIEFYGKYQEWYYFKNYSVKHKYKVGDLVRIPKSVMANIGYRGQLGIVQGYSGVENHIYVMAYSEQSDRYWVCGFEEDKLETPSVTDLYNYKVLVKEFVNWTYINDIKLSTREFKEMMDRYKKGENVFEEVK